MRRVRIGRIPIPPVLTVDIKAIAFRRFLDRKDGFLGGDIIVAIDVRSLVDVNSGGGFGDAVGGDGAHAAGEGIQVFLDVVPGVDVAGGG